jgi:hypothetical protein
VLERVGCVPAAPERSGYRVSPTSVTISGVIAFARMMRE